mmetsp:Transcript_30244/g.46152  ORF Transcript_30244/g.46152 Transcript_30244/m.46152 type:complete len:636 (+) Transcript_30244:132-2039(+)
MIPSLRRHVARTLNRQQKRLLAAASNKNTGRIVVKPPTQKRQPRLIKTNLEQHLAYLKSLQVDPNNAPSPIPDESGIVSRDLTDEVIRVQDMFDPRIHLPNVPKTWKGYEEGTPLTMELIQYMAVRSKPFTVADFMRKALTHEEYGYYTNPTDEMHEYDWDDDGSKGKQADEWDNDWDLDDERPSSTTTKITRPVTPDNFIIGRQGDFVTAPEVSQVFGECLSVWYATQWQTMNKPSAVQFVEVGPGKGTLMADILRSCLTMPSGQIGSAIEQVHFIEASLAMRQQQKRTLEVLLAENKNEEDAESHWNVHFVFHTDDDDDKKENELQESNNMAIDPVSDADNKSRRTIHVFWHASFSNFVSSKEEHLPAFVASQEFIDALPVHCFEKTKEGWRERMVDIAIANEEEDEGGETHKSGSKEAKVEEGDINSSPKSEKKTRLRVVLSPDASPACKTLLNVDENGNMKDDDSPVGQVCEVCPEGILFVQDVAKLLEKYGGAALIVDYGQEGSTDSIRGFSRHEQVSFLSRPGEVDITADVDFGALRHAVNHHSEKDKKKNDNDSIYAFGPVTQGNFLASMGIIERVAALIEDENTLDEQAEDLYAALERLVLPEQMGERYKVLAIAKKKDGIFEPPGF